MRPLLLASWLALASSLAGCIEPPLGHCDPKDLDGEPVQVFVHRDDGRAPLPGAWVEAASDGSTACLRTDEAGHAVFHLPPGEWSFVATVPTDDPLCVQQGRATAQVAGPVQVDVPVTHDVRICA